MRRFLLLTAAALALSYPASAQQHDAMAGTWAFQTSPYGDEQFALSMSGAAVVRREAPHRYAIQIIANELIVERSSGRSQMVTARQNCTGEEADGQITVSCAMAEPLEGYEPDNFILQQGEADQLVGVLSSATSAQVTFTRMR